MPLKHKNFGEYSKVCKLTRNLALLLSAHETPCNQDEAKALIETVARKYGLQVSAVRFKEGVRGWAYYKSQSLSLPASAGKGFGRLRVGIVLHEIAHLITRKKIGIPLRVGGMKLRRKTGEESHGTVFVSVLDDLLQGWSDGSLYTEEIDGKRSQKEAI